MEKLYVEFSSVKKMKLDVEQCSTEKEEPILVEKPTQNITFKSPKTEPMLTPEAWDQIFRGFSGSDFLSVINAAPEWNHLLGSKKTTELFPKIIPHLLPYLELNEMLACRGVQLDSKDAMDKFLEILRLSDQVISSNYESSLLRKMEPILENYSFGIDSREEIDKFDKALALETKAPCYNPFLTRTLSVTNYFEAEPIVAMSEFLARYGAHLRVFNFTFSERVDRNGAAILRGYSSLLPNLKVLKVYQEIAGERNFRIRELPPLEHLSTLKFCNSSAPSVTTKLIQRYGAQLTSLWVSGSWIKSSSIEESSFKALLPNLRRLRVENVDETVLEKLSVVDWPLEALHLKPKTSMFDKRELLLATVENFNKSLSQLELSLKKNYNRARNSNFDTEERISIEQKEDEEAMVMAESAFKQSTKMEKLVAYWKTAAGNYHEIKIVKTRSDNSVEKNQYKVKILRAPCPRGRRA